MQPSDGPFATSPIEKGAREDDCNSDEAAAPFEFLRRVRVAKKAVSLGGLETLPAMEAARSNARRFRFSGFRAWRKAPI
jgi:hypothetical protein